MGYSWFIRRLGIWRFGSASPFVDGGEWKGVEEVGEFIEKRHYYYYYFNIYVNPLSQTAFSFKFFLIKVKSLDSQLLFCSYGQGLSTQATPRLSVGYIRGSSGDKVIRKWNACLKIMSSFLWLPCKWAPINVIC